MRSEDGRECRSGCALADAEPQLAAATGRDRSCRFPRPVHRRNDCLRVPVKCATHLRELSAPAAASEQFDAKFVFKHSDRSEEHTSELQSLMRISYAVFCLKK